VRAVVDRQATSKVDHLLIGNDYAMAA